MPSRVKSASMEFIIFELGSRQYLTKPGQILEVDKLQGTDKTLVVDKILLEVADGKVEVGHPYLKKTVNFEVLENIKKEKVRVATYKPKANYRRVKGQRREMTRIKLLEEKIQAVKKSRS